MSEEKVHIVESQSTKADKKKRGPVARFLRFLLWLLFTPIILFFTLVALLYVPFIQDWAVGIACEKLSEETGKDVQVECVRLKFPLDFDLQKLCITQPDNSPSSADTLLAVEHCIVDLDLSRIFKWRLGVDAFDLQHAVVDSHDLIASLYLKGRLNQFHLNVHDLEYKESHVKIAAAKLDGCDLDIAMRDTTIIDTTTSQPLMWTLDFGKINLRDTRVAFHTANDTMSVKAGVEELLLERGNFDLGHNKLKLNNLELKADSVLYDQNYVNATRGLDFNHLGLYALTTTLPNLDYDLDAGHIIAKLNSLTVKEKCGLELKEFTAGVEIDTTQIKVRDAVIRTRTSQFKAWADIEYASLTPDYRGEFDAGLSAQFSKEDVMLFAGRYIPMKYMSQYPNRLITAEVEVIGNMDHVDVKSFRVNMPGVIDAKVGGVAGNLMTSKGLMANFDFDVHAQDLSLIKRLAGLTDVNLPPFDIKGTADIFKNHYKAKAQLRQAQGSLQFDAVYDGDVNLYDLKARANRFVVSNFLPKLSPCVVTADADLHGSGFDVLSRQTRLNAVLDVPYVQYKSQMINDVRLDAHLANGDGTVNFYSGDELLDANGCVDVEIRNQKVDSASFAFDLHGLDLYKLGVTKKPFKASMSMHMLGRTNLKDQHYVKGSIEGVQLFLKDTTFYPKDIYLESLIVPDSTFAKLDAGDLSFQMQSNEGVNTLVKRSTLFLDSLTNQIQNKHYDQYRLRAMMPVASLKLASGHENPVHHILHKMLGYSYQELKLNVQTHPEKGINADGHILYTNTGSIVLDNISFDIAPDDSAGMRLNARVSNGKKNKDVTFDSQLSAQIRPQLVGFSLVYIDSKQKKGVDMGANLTFHDDGIKLHLFPYKPLLAYRQFTVNPENYIKLLKDGRLDASLDLLADDGTGLKVFTTESEMYQQDITASLNHFNVGELCSVIPYMPPLTGLLHGDFHYTLQDKISTIAADMAIKQMTYDGYQMGDVGVNCAYMPNDDGSHFVDGFLTRNDIEVLNFTGTYSQQGETDNLDADATLLNFPMDMVNGFLGETINLTGNLAGALHVTGSTSKPRVDGSIVTDSLHVLSPMYSVNLRVQDDSLKVVGSRLNLNKINAYAAGSNPLVLDGIINFYDLGNITLDVNARAQNFELINAQRSREAAAYGKVFVDLNARARGTTNNLKVDGKLGILGNTNVTYVLKDSPINVEDEMSDLVTFCDFSDTVKVKEIEFVAPSNLDMNMQINIDRSANVNCLLSEDGVNYIKLEGGGELNMTYSGMKGLQLFGRYDILQGMMTYTMMVASLKDCSIQDGSYVEFTGPIDNPRLNVIAKERVNSSVTENETPRSVAFDVGLTITQTLSNMGLMFTLDAPEDMTVKNQIAQMTDEQRSRVAVTLMATGMYLVEGQQSGGFNTTNALNSFLQSQISSITGKALNTIDLSLGVANNQTATGSITTDYSFRFAKRFWGNRINLIIGGKVSSGSEAVNTGQSIIDNVSLEYRLDKSATRYVTIYYDNNNKSVLEGQVTEMGAGLVLRKKTDKLGELFLFKKSSELPVIEESIDDQRRTEEDE